MADVFVATLEVREHAMKKTQKIWVGVGAAVLLGSGTASLPATPSNGPTVLTSNELPQSWTGGHRPAVQLAQAATGGGEAGEGGEGGEGGINVEAASNDPVEYGIALQVIAAHYHAGLAAYADNEHEAGAQMFAHGLSEIYVAMEEVFKQRGVNDLGKKLQAAVNSAVEKKPLAEVKRRVRDVFSALAVAQKKAPKSAAISARAVEAQISVAMIERAAAQFAVVQKDKTLEPYLDGLGFSIAAHDTAKKVTPWLKKRDPAKATAVSEALALVAKAYPGIKRPAEATVPEGELLAAASRARLAVSSVK